MKKIPHPKNHFDVVIFDIDNVIVDTRFSYTDCIRETVQIYLVQKAGFHNSKKLLLSRENVERFKLLGGFNDDWDTCYGLLLYILKLAAKTSRIDELRKKINLKQLARETKPPLYIHGLEHYLGKNHQLKLEDIAPIFQDLYWKKYIFRESLIIQQKTFRNLFRSGRKIGIATGRNKQEANFVLKRFKILKYIHKIVSIDDLPSAKFKKPHPYSLLQIARTLGKKLNYLYVGDLPDDIETAKRAKSNMKVTAWGFSALSSSKTETNRMMRKAGAKKIIMTRAELNRLLC